jgi:large subunit ribosomal protein L23
MKIPQRIVKRPLLTEKSSRLRETGGADAAFGEDEEFSTKVVFEVERTANKVEIKEAVEKLFQVTVKSVRTQRVRGKRKRVGRYIGKSQAWKKAIVTLKAGENIEFFEGV